MFDELYKAAYEKLNNEIYSIAARLLTDVKVVHNSDYIGKLRVLNEVFNIMNNIDNELYNALLREVEKETAYYEAERAADNSSHEQK